MVNNDKKMSDSTDSESDNNMAKKRTHSDTELEGESNSSGKKKRKLKKLNNEKKLHKPPTVEELNRLRETENLFHSNLFRRQIEEMLLELKLSEKYKVRVNVWFEKFKEWLNKIEDNDERYDLNDLSFIKNRGIFLPVPALKPVKGSYQFFKPTRTFLVGSYVTQTALGHAPVDIVVEMPHLFFNKDDYLNAKYHLKRAIYLHELAQHLLLMKDLVEDIKLISDCNDPLPILEITPPATTKIKTKFVVYLVPQQNSFKLNRFNISKNNVRPKWFFGETYSVDDDCATPFYNTRVAEHLTLIDNEKYIEELVGQNEEIRNGIILLKVWLRQRELHLNPGGFSGFLISMLVLYLVRIRKITSSMSSYQIVRTVWNYLCSADWSSKGITLCDAASSEHQPSLHEFHQQFSLVFVDPSGFVNLTSQMSPLVFQQCKEESALALRYLDLPNINSFQVLFTMPVPFVRQCDQFIVFSDMKSLNEVMTKHFTEEKNLSFLGNISPMIIDKVVDILQRGLGERIRSLYIKLNPKSSWNIGKRPRYKTFLTLGLILNPDHCFSVVDKGPIADEEGSTAFRSLWGDKSELRRFKDGSITEAVVWQAQSWSEKRLITRQIVQYLLKTQLNITVDNYRFVADEVEAYLPSDRESCTSEVLTSFDELSKNLRDLEGLPLEIVSVQGTSPIFRCSDIFPPKLPHMPKHTVEGHKKKKFKIIRGCMAVNENARSVPNWCSPAEVLVQLSASNKWPNNLEAMQRIRAAFNLKIAQLLSKKLGRTTYPFQTGFDVLMEKSLFRISVCYPGEVALLKKSITPDGVVLYKNTVESFKVEKSSEHLPKINSALHGLHSQHTSLGTACCVAKRWVRTHMVDEEHLSDEAIDLLMASVYMNPEPWQPPSQPQTAFLRFLYRLAHTNWSVEFILLNFNDELSAEDIREIESYFDNNRSTLPSIFISTSYDKYTSVWTQGSCPPVVLLRLINLAKLASSLFEQQFQSPSGFNLQAVFTTSQTVYDVQIHILPAFLPRLNEAVITSRSEVPAANQNWDILPVVQFDPLQRFVTELRESYGEWALFFYDPYGGCSVGVLWKPGYDDPRDIKVSHLHGRYLRDNKLHLNKSSIIEGFRILGKGIVKSIMIKEGPQFVPFFSS